MEIDITLLIEASKNEILANRIREEQDNKFFLLLVNELQRLINKK